MSKINNRIWEDGESMTWSTINELLGEDHAAERLQSLVLDLTDNLLDAAEKAAKLKERIQGISENLGACINFGQKKLGYLSTLSYIHDRENKTVTVSVNDGVLSVDEHNLTMLTSSPNQQN